MKATGKYHGGRDKGNFKVECHNDGKGVYCCQDFWELKNNSSSIHRGCKYIKEAYNAAKNTQSRDNYNPNFMLMNIDGVKDEEMELAAQ